METPPSLPGSQFGHPPALAMMISSPGTQPELPSLCPEFIAPGTQLLVSQGDFCISESLQLFWVFPFPASGLSSRGFGDVGHVQVPGCFVHHQRKQSTEKLISLRVQPCTSTSPGPICVEKEARLSGPKEKHNHLIQEPEGHLRPWQAEEEPSLWCPWLGQEGGICWETPPAPRPLSLPARQAAAVGPAPSSLPTTPTPSLNQQIIALTLQMFNFLLQLHQFCSRRGRRGEQTKTSRVFPNKPRATGTSGLPSPLSFWGWGLVPMPLRWLDAGMGAT